jgi:hypothetical protein
MSCKDKQLFPNNCFPDHFLHILKHFLYILSNTEPQLYVDNADWTHIPVSPARFV